jgi:hypothetical protein
MADGDDDSDDQDENEDEEEKDDDGTSQSPRPADAEAAGGPLQPVDDDVMFFDDSAPDVEELVEAFLQRILDGLEKELGVSEPEIDIWTDWGGAYDPSLRSATSIPGTGT